MEDKNMVLTSPFVFHNEMVLVRDNLYNGKRSSLSLGGFLRLEEKGILTEFDRMVLLQVLNRGYVTRKCINICIPDKDCKDSLKKLCENGILERYHYVYECNGLQKRTVNFYGIGDAAKKASVIGIKKSLTMNIKKDFKDYSYDYVLNNPVSAISLLEYNIFDAQIMNDYKDYITKRYDNFLFKKGTVVYNQPYMYNVSRTSPNEEGNDYLIIPVVTRRSYGWRKEIFTLLCHITQCVSNKFGNKIPIFIVNTEDNVMACEAAIKQKDYPALNDSAVFFISDWGVNNEMILDNLINVVKPEKEMYEIIQLQL